MFYNHKTFFGINLSTLVCELDKFTTLRQLLLALIKWASLQKSVSKFKPKKVYVIDPWSQYCKKISPQLMAQNNKLDRLWLSSFGLSLSLYEPTNLCFTHKYWTSL